MKINFRIEHIDPLGQGVDKTDGSITFIKKTLPGEEGVADVYSEKKGVRFAKLNEISTAAPERIEAECEHYSTCNGCDYQHTSYEKELEYKKAALARHLFKFNNPTITAHGAKHRFNYRNRIQLHYDKKKKVMGLLDERNNILPVPKCRIIDPSVAFELRRLYENNTWLNLVVKQPVQGHIEIYAKDQDKPGHNVQISVNRPYADGGFTQVNYEMNEVLRNWVLKKAREVIPTKAVVYDLFGGNGNITKKFLNQTIVVDKYRKFTPEPAGHQKFFSIDLYDPNAVKALINIGKEGNPRPNWLIIDPPRSGLKNLEEFINEFKPDGIIFIACEATSFARDTVSILKNYELESAELFDLFPSTKAFETVGIFTRRKNTL